jgi:hypothetical protein
LKLGKACGPDDLSAEHIVYAHPSLLAVICKLFRLIATHRYVPNGFCSGTIVPLIKDKARNQNDIDNHRPITLMPVVSKVFELVRLTLSEDHLISSDLQFGFKCNLNCDDAIFVLRATVDYFDARKSTVYLAS